MATFTLPPLLTDKLSAVNTLLASISESPVSALEPPQGVDAQVADTAIDEVTNAVLSKGYFFNREYGMSLSPDTNKQILLPDNCLYIGRAYGDWQDRVTERGRKLYHTEDHSYVFDRAVTLDLILRLAWEEMPEYARRYITIRAAQLFQGRVQQDRVVYSVQESEVNDALATLEQREDEANPQNVLTNSYDTRAKVYGRGLRRKL